MISSLTAFLPALAFPRTLSQQTQVEVESLCTLAYPLFHYFGFPRQDRALAIGLRSPL